MKLFSCVNPFLGWRCNIVVCRVSTRIWILYKTAPSRSLSPRTKDNGKKSSHEVKVMRQVLGSYANKWILYNLLSGLFCCFSFTSKMFESWFYSMLWHTVFYYFRNFWLWLNKKPSTTYIILNFFMLANKFKWQPLSLAVIQERQRVHEKAHWWFVLQELLANLWFSLVSNLNKFILSIGQVPWLEQKMFCKKCRLFCII